MEVAIDFAGVGREADVGIDIADFADGLANDAVDHTCVKSALVVISPATTTRSVVTKVSQATRLRESAPKQWSRIVSLIWSATLSGWPMETDSLVNKYWSALTVGVLGWLNCRHVLCANDS